MDRSSHHRLTSWRLGIVGLVLTATLAAAQTPPASPQAPKPPPSPEFKDLDAPRAHSYGQAWLMLDVLDVVRDCSLRAAIADTAGKFYGKDVDCKTESEPAAADLVSPCLAERC